MLALLTREVRGAKEETLENYEDIIDKQMPLSQFSMRSILWRGRRGVKEETKVVLSIKGMVIKSGLAPI